MRRQILGATLAQVLAAGGHPPLIREVALNLMPKSFIRPSIIPTSIPMKKKKKKLVSAVVPIIAKPEVQPDTKPEEAKVEEKQEDKKSKRKMRKWPDDESALVDYHDIVRPLKEILRQGYRLFRKDQKEFDYEGYSIGPNELTHFPPPKYRFTEKLLEFDDKRGKKLIDVVLNVMFLLGVEQGRRAEKREGKPMELVLKAMDKYRDENKNLRLKLDELEVSLEVRQQHPELNDDDFQNAVSDGVRRRRNIRLYATNKELGIGPVRSAFEFKTPRKVQFEELESLARTLNKDICTQEQWKDLLKERGWTYEEWQTRCKKKFVRTDFS